ncbi:MAG TPA: AzlC family ABC transporter permease [Xanthobacteraceae bacterium]|nr:AzlC family ABC transporter permease [Xanthobacteraceae bacterium]
MAIPDTAGPPAYWSRKALMPGVRAVAPVLPGTLAFGIAFGALCAQKHFTLTEVQLFMAVVYGGMSQFVAVQAWPDVLTASSIAQLALLTATVNIRFSLMTASLRPWLGSLPPWQTYPALLLITDTGWLSATRYRNGGGADASFYLGGGIALYLVWFVAALPGYFLAGSLSDPKMYGLDMVFPAFFAAMLVPAWRGIGFAIPWLVAGIMAIIVERVVGGWWFIIIGALSGAITAGLMGDGDE